MDKPSNWVVLTQLSKLLVENNPIAWFVHILPSTGLYLAQHFLECISGLCSLGPLVGKVKECQVETMVDTLCSNMVSNKEQLRDISSMGLKTVIAELPPSSTGIEMILDKCPSFWDL